MDYFRHFRLREEESTSMPAGRGAFSRELELYQERKSEWLIGHESEFVVICKDQVAGFFPDYASAFVAGVKQFGVRDPFLIKQVCSIEPIHEIYFADRCAFL